MATRSWYHLFALWDALDLGDRVTLVLHDWGSALGFDWANRHRDRVAGIAYMEAIAMPMDWDHFPEPEKGVIQGFRSSQGEAMVLDDDLFVEAVPPGAVQRTLGADEMDHHRRPFRSPGEDRRPTLSWPRDTPITGEPADVVAIVEGYGTCSSESDVPELFVNADPGFVTRGRVRDFARTWPHQTEVTVPGIHFIQEDSPDEIGRAVASFVRAIRPSDAGAMRS